MKNLCLKILLLVTFVCLFAQFCFAFKLKAKNKIIKTSEETLQENQEQELQSPSELEFFRKAYPDLKFESSFDKEKDDWKISISLPNGANKIFYWCNGSLLPPEELEQKGEYWALLYPYAKELKDPALMTEEEKTRLKEFSSRSNRREGKGTPMFFFEFIYSSSTRADLEKHLVSQTFLGKKTSIHERISVPLKNIELKILEQAKTDSEVNAFVQGLKSSDAYNWRIIDGTNRKSFHSLGIAIDVLPKRITGEIFWSWARDKNPNGWMLTPLSKRWIPPKAVVQIFEQEGFIWGGKWGIWDNMHFEYHPEIILFNEI